MSAHFWDPLLGKEVSCSMAFLKGINYTAWKLETSFTCEVSKSRYICHDMHCFMPPFSCLRGFMKYVILLTSDAVYTVKCHAKNQYLIMTIML